MKKFTTKIISFMLTLSMLFSISVPVFASETVNFKNSDISYTIVSSNQTEYGTIYYVKEDGRPQTRTVWDILDVAMAGYSWSKLLDEPSWGNFGWAVLDTAALLPLIPSTAYFREGGKVLLKADEFAKFAKTAKGKNAIKAAMKTYKYDRIEQGLNFTITTSKHMNNPDRYVPVLALKQAIKEGKAYKDPRGSKALMYYSTMYRNGKKYNLEVLYDTATNTVFHFMYDTRAMGPLPKINK